MAEYDDKKPRAEDLLFAPVPPRNLTLLPVLVLSPQSRMSYARTKKPTLSGKNNPFSIAVLAIVVTKGVSQAVSSLSIGMGKGMGGPAPAAPSGPGFGGR